MIVLCAWDLYKDILLASLATISVSIAGMVALHVAAMTDTARRLERWRQSRSKRDSPAP